MIGNPSSVAERGDPRAPKTPLCQPTRRSQKRLKLLVAIAASAVVSVSLAAKRDRVTSFPPAWPHRAPWKLDKTFLLPSAHEIRFVVEVVRGAQPKGEALDHLVEIAEKYSGTPASWIPTSSPDAPKVVFAIPQVPVQPVTVIFRGDENSADWTGQLQGDVSDSVRYFSEVPSCADDMSDGDITYVFIRFLGKWGGSYGAASVLDGAGKCEGKSFHVIYLAQDEIALQCPPGFSRAFLEKRALVHEFGHVIGLPANPTHGRWSDTISYKGVPHCVNRECAVASPSRKALLRGLMLDYCLDCQRDITQARRYWLEGVQFPKDEPLPQPDPMAIVAKLKNYQFRPGGEAAELVEYGKFIMPALIERLSQLPGDKYGSPRYSAARLAIEIIVAEDRARRKAQPRYFSPKGDHSSDLREWWSLEGDAFMSGDTWKLPSKVLFEAPSSP